jgi:hypothetical protein
MRRAPIVFLADSLPPETTPTAIRTANLLSRIAQYRPVIAVTGTEDCSALAGVEVHVVARRYPRRLDNWVRTAHLGRLLELLVWPDEELRWAVAAVAKSIALARERRAGGVVAFMMPYSAGLGGMMIRRATGLPLVLCLDDSPTCTDMHAIAPTRLHHLGMRLMEDAFANHAEALVYVSRRNLERVRARQPPGLRSKFKLVRYAADPAEFAAVPPSLPPVDEVRILYIGGMVGWYALYRPSDRANPRMNLRRIFRAMMRLGRYEAVKLDYRSSTPVPIGHAARAALHHHPDWAGKLQISVYGANPDPRLTAQVLEEAGLTGLVWVNGPVPHAEAIALARGADLLFLTLPKRRDGSPGGRISAKTYEYLMTDRPILAALSAGENQDYLAGKPGVWIVAPDDIERMREVVETVTAAKMAGAPMRFDRSGLRKELDYANRALELERIIRSVTASE